jgi:hypothetical protein
MNTALSESQSLALRRLLETGLPLAPRPFQALAEQIEASEAQVLEQMRQWHEQGLFRRVGLVVNHQAPGISLCYQRPRRLPQWQYNLFCMIHGRQRDRVEAQVQALLQEHLLDDLPHQLLFSTHLFKQCGGRFAAPAGASIDG